MVIFLAERFRDFICEYIKGRAEVLQGYLIGALESKEGYLCYLDESLGTPLPSLDIRNCELLTNAELLHEEIKLTRNGRNRYKIFSLNDLGREMAQQIKEEGYDGEVQINSQVHVEELQAQ